MTTARKCVACSRCLSFCPVFLSSQREEWSPKAKNQLFEHLAAGDARLDEAPCRKLGEMCVSCGRCVAACAQHLSVPERLAELRAAHPGWEQYLWDLWITRGDMLWPALGTIGKALGDAPGKGVLAGAKAMGATPRIAPWISVREYDRHAGGRRIQFFAGCTARRVRPGWLATSQSILEGLGYEVVRPREACCGGTLLSAGLRKSAQESMAANVTAWREAGRPMVTTACASCLHALGAYPQHEGLFLNADEARQWSAGLSSLAALWGKTTFELRDQPPSLRWHTPCHGLTHKADQNWLRSVVGKALVAPQGITCCGLGGVVQLSNRQLSMDIAAACWEALAPGPGTQVLTGCSGCTIQLTATRPRGVHVAHWLDVVRA